MSEPVGGHVPPQPIILNVDQTGGKLRLASRQAAADYAAAFPPQRMRPTFRSPETTQKLADKAVLLQALKQAQEADNTGEKPETKKAFWEFQLAWCDCRASFWKDQANLCQRLGRPDDAARAQAESEKWTRLKGRPEREIAALNEVLGQRSPGAELWEEDDTFDEELDEGYTGVGVAKGSQTQDRGGSPIDAQSSEDLLMFLAESAKTQRKESLKKFGKALLKGLATAGKILGTILTLGAPILVKHLIDRYKARPWTIPGNW